MMFSGGRLHKQPEVAEGRPYIRPGAVVRSGFCVPGWFRDAACSTGGVRWAARLAGWFREVPLHCGWPVFGLTGDQHAEKEEQKGLSPAVGTGWTYPATVLLLLLRQLRHRRVHSLPGARVEKGPEVLSPTARGVRHRVEGKGQGSEWQRSRG